MERGRKRGETCHLFRLFFNYAYHFLGVSVAKKSFAFCDLQNMPIAEVADHYPDTKIITYDYLLAIAGIAHPDDRYKSRKKDMRPVRTNTSIFKKERIRSLDGAEHWNMNSMIVKQKIKDSN